MSLLSFLKSSKGARKVFGSAELKIVEKQLLGLNLTQSEKNRLSRDVRKKFEFIKDVARFSGEFGLKKGGDIRAMVEDARGVILKDKLSGKIKQVLLFGSAVENKLSFKSDVDIAVKFDDISFEDATLFRKRVSGRVNSRVDVQVYNCLPRKLKLEIDKKGRVLR